MNELNLDVAHLGECTVATPLRNVQFTSDDRRILYHTERSKIEALVAEGLPLPAFEAAGPREKIFFDPRDLACGIVTCGGICPGLNDVIRAIVLSLRHHYGVTNIYGFRYGYEGLVERYGHEPVTLDVQAVNHIQRLGGTVLGSSRGGQDIGEMVDTLERRRISILFTIGGDGTLRGAQAIAAEAERRGLPIAVIGIPKTIDNDISYTDRSFGFQTAGGAARGVITSAHSEAASARNGITLVKLMGRESGFIAAYAALADSEVNFCLIPEVPFPLPTFLEALRDRLTRMGHAVVVVAEGAGQDLLPSSRETDPSGNPRLGDIGLFLRDAIRKHFAAIGMEISLKYIDPSYTIRSVPANANDAAFCLLLGHNAVHAGMAGRTNMVVGFWKNEFTHVPIPLAVSKRKKINPQGWTWSSVLATTGQPLEWT